MQAAKKTKCTELCGTVEPCTVADGLRWVEAWCEVQRSTGAQRSRNTPDYS